jgi:hypothetical protein
MRKSSSFTGKLRKNTENGQLPIERAELDALWAQEAEDRIAAYKRGEMETIPAEEVFAEIEKNRLGHTDHGLCIV